MLRYVKNIVYFYFLLLLIYFCNLEFKLKFWKVLWWIYMYIVLFMDEYCIIKFDVELLKKLMELLSYCNSD